MIRALYTQRMVRLASSALLALVAAVEPLLNMDETHRKEDLKLQMSKRAVRGVRLALNASQALSQESVF